MILALSIAGIVIAIVPAAIFWSNLPLFSMPYDTAKNDTIQRSSVSVLIPARDEALAIGRTIDAALASERVDVEVVVLDDGSTDATAEIVQRIAAKDARVKYVFGRPLPDGWNGKQYACKQLADAASHDRILFVDADVRLRPNGLIRLIERQNQTGVALLSAFPHQETGTIFEKGIIPLMHFILLGFLPLSRMRASHISAYAAGCGQLFLTNQTDYHRAGTHEVIRGSRHDGLKLPRAYRDAGMMTDVIDGTELAECRMYCSAAEVIRGVLKNAVEGIAHPKLIMLFSVLLLGSSVLPVLTLVWAIHVNDPLAIMLSMTGIVLGHMPRAIAAIRFRQPLSGVILHSVATLVFVGLQWVALINHLLGRRIAWRGRVEA